MAPETPANPDGPQTHEIGRRTYIVADVDPLDVDGVRTVAVGTAIWLVAFVGLLPFYGRLRDDDRLWWLWTCLAGFGLGLAGWDYCRRRRRHRLEQQGDAEDEPVGRTILPPVVDVPADPPIAPAPRPAVPPQAEAQKPAPAKPAKPPFMPGKRPGE